MRVNVHGDLTVLADRFEGRRLNSPNDLVYASDGTLYFTDPPFGLPGGFDDPARELPFSGVFAVSDGSIRLVTDELAGPNGIALSPDERRLYVSDGNVIARVDPAGGEMEVVHAGDERIEGLETDGAGNLYACVPGGVRVLAPGGEPVELIELPEPALNLAWGEGGLYVTATTSIYRVRRTP